MDVRICARAACTCIILKIKVTVKSQATYINSYANYMQKFDDTCSFILESNMDFNIRAIYKESNPTTNRGTCMIPNIMHVPQLDKKRDPDGISLRHMYPLPKILSYK